MQGRGHTQPPGTHLLERLAAEGRIGAAEHRQALAHAEQTGVHVQDALVDLGAMAEEELLRYQASVYGMRFVGTRKLGRARIDPRILRMVPARAAEKLGVCPILYDAARGALSVVAADPGASDVAKEVQMVSRAREVRVFVAMPAAVHAAIHKHYHGDATAFAALELPAGGVDTEWRAPVAGPGAVAVDPASAPPPAPDALPTLEDPPPAAAEPVPAPPSSVGWDAYLESLNVLVTLLEQGRGDLRGHSALVARHCRGLGRRLNLPAERLHAILAAAYLHDLGKASTYHLTALNVASYDGHRVQAEKTHEAPLRLLEQAELPGETRRALAHMYERADGGGFPSGLKGKDIPLGARVLAVVDSYADLTGNSRNPHRRRLSPREACDALEKLRGGVFDGAVLDALRREVLGDEIRARLLADRRRILLVDPDAEETTVLEMRLMEHGHEVVVARTGPDALACVDAGQVDAVVTEVDVPPDGGFELARALAERGEMPVVFLTRRGDRRSVARGFELGAADYLVKPASAEVLVAKIQQLMEGTRTYRSSRGVTGSLQEMGLPDVVQILGNGRKTGRLSVRAGGQQGEVWFGDGEIHDARLGDLRGEEAFYRMLQLTEGDFELEPSVPPPERTIQASCEALLLEGMRRMDEGIS
ncbi:MAG: DUF4388 domain-containing protein [Myxococcota bacterium]